ncbi:MAG: SWIM zinc finger family protein [Myxococcota bacterium]
MGEENETRRRRPRRRRRSGRGGGGGKPAGDDKPANGGEGAETRAQSRGESRAESRGDAPRRGRPRGKKNGRGRGRSARGRSRPRREKQAENWWARRWIEVLESFDVGRRLGRGRSYARQGQVVDLELGKGFVTAKVQGSRDAPYLVRMRLSMLSSTDWKKVTRRIAEDPELVESLVRGQIPEDIEETFAPLGLSLFPTVSGDLKTACSCPDQANPCKHVAAVYYLLGEEFDRDPFLVFRLRGIDRSEIVEAIGGSAALRGPLIPAPERQEAPAPPEPEPEAAAADADEELEEEAEAEETQPQERPPEPLPTEAHAFWAGEAAGDGGRGEVRIPLLPGALARRLGGYPFFRGSDDCDSVVQRVYKNASIAGLDVYLGESESD